MLTGYEHPLQEIARFTFISWSRVCCLTSQCPIVVVQVLVKFRDYGVLRRWEASDFRKSWLAELDALVLAVLCASAVDFCRTSYLDVNVHIFDAYWKRRQRMTQ